MSDPQSRRRTVGAIAPDVWTAWRACAAWRSIHLSAARNEAVQPTTRTGSSPAALEPSGSRVAPIAAQDCLPLLKQFCATLKASGTTLLIGHQVQRELGRFLEQLATPDAPPDSAADALRRLLRGCIEILPEGESAYLVLRPDIGRKSVVLVHPGSSALEEIDRDAFLEVKDAHVQGWEEASKRGLVLDFSPFFRDFPKVHQAKEMGEGISFLNRHLSAQLYQNPRGFQQALLDFMQHREYGGVSVLINDHLSSPRVLLQELTRVLSFLEERDDDEPREAVTHELRTHGFEVGWGRTVGRIRDSLELLQQVLESSEPARFERLLERLPLIRTVLMVSPHGWFAQDGVLGRPDTGGQVTYVLDQALALEQQIQNQLDEAGIAASPKIIVLTRLIPNAEGTTCNMPRERINGSQDSWIVRVPLRGPQGETLESWISRFQIWPYLEQFAEESKHFVVTELLGKPDLIVGHYTDGNLVAHRLAEELQVTHAACVHALEKTKYLLSDQHWQDLEPEYHFSLQFTADLVAYNSADFIISSSYREVGGTRDEMGMIESYELFSMPGLYRVTSGFDPRLARHNIVPPGASEEYFFGNEKTGRRVEAVAQGLRDRFLGPEPGPGSVGALADPALPWVFAMARMDRIKNLSGLIEIFGRHELLRRAANLLLITSVNDPDMSQDHEEIDEVRRAHQFIEQYALHGSIRWCAARLDKVETGEIYRLVADGHGVFAQPAFMETFGLTVIEAMACGLPVVVTCFGGPAEIVEDHRSGLIANPNDQPRFADALHAVVSDPSTWRRLAEGGVQRVQEAFTWRMHARSLLRLANVYTYWNHIDVMNRQALDRYIHTLYHTVYRPRTQTMLYGPQ